MATVLPITHAQSVAEYQLKAAFIFNFAKFVEWPAQSIRAANDPLVICLLGGNPFGNTLQETINHKEVNGKSFRVQQLSSKENACQCQILFVDPAARKQFRALLPTLKAAGVLTVGEDDTFTADGGVIDFKLDGGKVHLEINTAAAEYEDLRISSKLLSLAQVVRKAP
jgi:hypothetical protein